MKTYGYIYKIVCKNNGKIYIGQTTRDLDCRLKSHFYESVNEHRSITKMGSAILKHGRKNFEIYSLCRAESKEELNRREVLCIRLFDSVKNGYNIRKGGQSTGPWSLEEKKKMSISRKGKSKPRGFGEKISKALKGKKKSESHKYNNRQAQIECQAHRDFRHTPESKKKISLGNKGKIMPPGFGENVAKRNKERGPASEETKKKMSLKRQGRKPSLGLIHTAESKKNISEGLKNSKRMDKIRSLIYCENNNKTYLGCRLAAEDLGIKTQHIYDFFHGRTKTAKGFIFKKLN
jgi:group I intron endonuclease